MSSVSAATTPTSDASATADLSKQKAALAKLLRTYTADINKGQSADQLKSLAKQITTAAQALGQNVTLPKATQSSSAAPAPAASPPSSAAGKVSLTA